MSGEPAAPNGGRKWAVLRDAALVIYEWTRKHAVILGVVGTWAWHTTHAVAAELREIRTLTAMAPQITAMIERSKVQEANTRLLADSLNALIRYYREANLTPEIQLAEVTVQDMPPIPEISASPAGRPMSSDTTASSPAAPTP